MLGHMIVIDWIEQLFTPAPKPLLSSVQLSTEQLDDRCVPATLVWDGKDDGLWSNRLNWLDGAFAPPNPPGQNDTVRFDGAKQTHSRADSAKVGAVEITGSYEKTITIETGQQKVSTLEVMSAYTMSAGNAFVSGGNDGNGTLQLSGASTFTWSAGKIRTTNVQLGAADNHAVTATISNTVIFDSSTLDNHGTVTTSDSYVKVTTGTSSIINRAGATFNATKFHFGDALIRNVGTVENLGTMKLGGQTVIDADTINRGTLRLAKVDSGSPEFVQSYRQYSGTTELYDNPFVELDGPGDHIHIHGGKLIGNGTLDGNLTLGYEGDATAGDATINPGWTTTVMGFPVSYTPGTITVTQSFEMFDTTNTMRIDVIASGGFDKVVVQGLSANLKGTLDLNNSAYKPEMGVMVDFLNATTIGGVFTTKTYFIGNWSHPTNPGYELYWTLVKEGDRYSIQVAGKKFYGPP